MKKTKIRSLEDISRAKHKVQKEIALHEYAIRLHSKEIGNKLSFASLSGYVFGLVKERLLNRMPGFFAGLLKGFLSGKGKTGK